MWSQRKQRPEDHRQNRNQTITQHMQRLGVDATGMGERVSFQVSDEDGDRYRSVSVDRIKKFVQICG